MNRSLDRVVRYDVRSLEYPVAATVEGKAARSNVWPCPAYLDQGEEGACVGFAWAHELAARPKPVRHVNDGFALGLYEEAKRADEWDGEDYDGTSVLAGVKVVKDKQYLKEYRWAFSLDDLIMAAGYVGPIVMGTWWWTGMLDADSSGLVHRAGQKEGGHSWLVRGVNIGGRYFVCRNSWGRSWGLGGDFKVTYEDMENLLFDEGEGCIPTIRTNRGVPWYLRWL